MEIVKFIVHGILYPMTLFLILGYANESGKRQLDKAENVIYLMGIITLLAFGGFSA